MVYSYVTFNYAKVANGGKSEKQDYKLLHGEFLDLTTNGSIAIVKAKIQPNLTNKLTVEYKFPKSSDYRKAS